MGVKMVAIHLDSELLAIVNPENFLSIQLCRYLQLSEIGAKY